MFELDREKFGPFVAELRKEHGYTQKELAKKLFISDKAVSKWETGASIPDTALLVPLAELLEVTVTELLLCRRAAAEPPPPAGEVEELVRQAAAAPPARICDAHPQWVIFYLLSALAGLAGLILDHCGDGVWGCVVWFILFSLGFGVYFCIFARVRLPRFYDEHDLAWTQWGVPRKRLDGIAINNSNWPAILRTGRIWSCLNSALLPLLAALGGHLDPPWWNGGEKALLSILFFGGLFIPALFAVISNE